LTTITAQLEEIEGKKSSVDKEAKNLRQQVEELNEQLTEETRAKIAANNKQKQLQDEVERLNGQLEDEEEAKDALQAKLNATNAQVRMPSFSLPLSLAPSFSFSFFLTPSCWMRGHTFLPYIAHRDEEEGRRSGRGG